MVIQLVERASSGQATGEGWPLLQKMSPMEFFPRSAFNIFCKLFSFSFVRKLNVDLDLPWTKLISIRGNSTLATMRSVSIDYGIGIVNKVSLRDRNHRENKIELVQCREKAPW
jgi:hypothetical protein